MQGVYTVPPWLGIATQLLDTPLNEQYYIEWVHTVFLSVITRIMDPIPAAATVYKGYLKIQINAHLYTPTPHLFVPDKQYTAGVLCWVGKATVDVLHEDVSLICAEGVHSLLYICSFEPCQHIQHNAEVSLLGVH